MCATGLSGWALVQTVPGHQAPDWEGSCGRQSEESQVHPQRHWPVGRRCRVLCPGEMRSHKNYPYAQTRDQNSSRGFARQTQRLWLPWKRPKPPTGDCPRLCDIHFPSTAQEGNGQHIPALAVYTHGFKLPACTCRCALLQPASARSSDLSAERSYFLLKPTQIKERRVIALWRVIIKFGWITRLSCHERSPLWLDYTANEVDFTGSQGVSCSV